MLVVHLLQDECSWAGSSWQGDGAHPFGLQQRLPHLNTHQSPEGVLKQVAGALPLRISR